MSFTHNGRKGSLCYCVNNFSVLLYYILPYLDIARITLLPSFVFMMNESRKFTRFVINVKYVFL